MTIAEIEAELRRLAPQLVDAYADGSRATLLEARNWRLQAELRYRGDKEAGDADDTYGSGPGKFRQRK